MLSEAEHPALPSRRRDPSAVRHRWGRCWSRRVGYGLLAAAMAFGPVGASLGVDATDALARGQRDRNKPEEATAKRRRRASLASGCSFLAGKQNSDGSFGQNRAVVAITALSVLALMSNGSTDHRGTHRKSVHKGINFLLKLIEADNKPKRYPKGYFFYPHDQDSRMHGQGYATLALACALGTSERQRFVRIRRALLEAVACIEASQARTGGFGYAPSPDHDHEGSVTVTVAQGLRAARDAGLVVSERVVSRGLRYLVQSQKSDGSFQYSLSRPVSSYALTAAALSSFFLYGRYEDRDSGGMSKGAIGRGLAYMREQLETRGADQPWYYYGHFYASWALWQWDGDSWDVGKSNHWGPWQQLVYPSLMARQTSNGSFEPKPGRFDYGPVLSSAFAVLTLSIPDEGLPIFQR